MSRMDIAGVTPSVVYVCDHGRVHQLLMSITSWARFATVDVCVVDIGLTEADLLAITAVTPGTVRFLRPAGTFPVPNHVINKHRTFAYAQKTLVGSVYTGDPVIFLDSDIVVVHCDFLQRLFNVRQGELLAAPSFWDSDFNWTYSPESLPWLRLAIGNDSLSLTYPVCNSGVWAMRQGDASDVSLLWHAMFRNAIESAGLGSTLNQGTDIGDQEFLLPSCEAAGVKWIPLPAVFNMQVHHNRTPWSSGAGGHPFGSGCGKQPELVQAIHFGCNPDGAVLLEDGMLPSLKIKEWVAEQYRICWDFVREQVSDLRYFPERTSK